MFTALTAIMFCPLIFLSNRAGTTPGWQKEAKRKSSYKCSYEKWVSGKDKEEWHLYYQFDSRFKAGEERKETVREMMTIFKMVFCHIIFWSNRDLSDLPASKRRQKQFVGLMIWELRNEDREKKWEERIKRNDSGCFSRCHDLFVQQAHLLLHTTAGTRWVSPGVCKSKFKIATFEQIYWQWLFLRMPRSFCPAQSTPTPVHYGDYRRQMGCV